MYYNSNQNSNEYYSSYKQELSAVEKNKTQTKTISLSKKIGIGILFLGVIGVSSPYLIKEFSKGNITSTTLDKILTKTDTTDGYMVKKDKDLNSIPKIVISKEKLPKSIQLQDSESKIIANLKHNATDYMKEDSPLKSKEHNEIRKQVISLTETSNMNSEDIENIVSLILAKKKKNDKSSLEEELLNAELDESPTQTLKESNHYNKVVLSSKNENTNSKLLTIDDDFSKSNKKIQLSKYEKSLKSEITTRSNEMRIIIVKKGDSLSKLAKKAYGDRMAYRKIFKANPEIIKNPNQIFVGQKIRIPL